MATFYLKIQVPGQSTPSMDTVEAKNVTDAKKIAQAKYGKDVKFRSQPTSRKPAWFK